MDVEKRRPRKRWKNISVSNMECKENAINGAEPRMPTHKTDQLTGCLKRERSY